MSKHMRRGMHISWLRCSECGNWYPIQRMLHRDKKEGHLKHVWCVYCQKETSHIEYREKLIEEKRVE